MKKYLSVILALCMVFTLGMSVMASADEAEVMDHAAYIEAELDSAVKVECYVQAHQSWWNDKVTVYAQDEDGAYFLYELACTEEDADKLVPGTKIIVEGYKGEWSGEVEIMDGTFVFADDADDTFIAEACDVTELLADEEALSAHMNEFVSFKGMTVVASKDADGNEAAFLYNWDGSGQEGNDVYFNVSLDGETYTFLVRAYLTDATTDVYKAAQNLSIGEVIDMEGFLYWYNGVNPHITSIAAAE